MKRWNQVAVFFGMAVALSLPFVMDGEARPVLLPVGVASFIAIWTWRALTSKDGSLPIFDVGALFTFVVLLYSVVPLLGYLAGGLAFSLLSDSRLASYDPTAEEMGAFAWRYVLFLAAFCATYVLLRTRARLPAESRSVDQRDPAMAASVVLWAGMSGLYLTGLWAATGFSFSASYDDLQESATLYASLPRLVQQASHNIAGILVVMKLALLIILYAAWKRRGCRLLLAAWIAIEILTSVIGLGARTPLLIFLLANVLLYHRFVRKLSFTSASLAVLALASGVLALGFVRDYLGVTSDVTDVPILSVSNEFQALFGTGYDIAQRQAHGDLEVPWQIYVSDILRLFPQQILPFEKFDPQIWYLKVLGLEGTGIGFMFGTIAESILLGGWAGLALRGALLGVLFWLAHSWYRRRQGDFYVTIAYLWLCLHAYYCIRATTLYLLVWVVYRLIPAIALIAITRSVLLNSSKGAMKVRPSGGADV
jgi:hypothetical protein